MIEQIHNSWQRWLEASESLTSLLLELTAVITLHDTERFVDLLSQTDKQIAQLKKVAAKARREVRALALTLDVEPTIEAIIQHLDTEDARKLQRLVNHVILAAGKLEEVLNRNRELVSSEMNLVDGKLTFRPKPPTRRLPRPCRYVANTYATIL